MVRGGCREVLRPVLPFVAIGREGNGVRMSQSCALAEHKTGDLLEIQSTRFGPLTVEPDRIITFSRGLLGFPRFTRYAMIQAGEDNYFFWLQCVDDPNLAFVITDPGIFFKSYDVPLKEEAQQELALTDPSAVQIFVICNKVGEWLTGNLLGPIVINGANRQAQQIVLTEKKWTTRQPLLQLRSELPLAKSA
jgi:flagellar assembly factor FliW